MSLLRRSGLVLVALLCACASTPPVVEPGSIEARLLARVIDVPETNTQRYERLVELFEQDGCVHPNLLSLPVGRSPDPNLECTLPGETDALILVGAHFDKLGDHQAVVDNWTGTCLLPALYRALASRPRRHTFRFIGFTGEEVGLRGSKDYVRNLTDAQRSSVRAMVNLDTFGWGSPKAVLNRTNPRLATHLESVLQRLDLPQPKLKMDGYADDSAPFRRAGMPTIVFTGLSEYRVLDLHTAQDKVANLDQQAYLDAYQLLSQYLDSLDGFLTRPEER